MKKLYLNIAGFLIEIKIYQAERELEKKIILDNIKKYYKKYLISPTDKKHFPEYRIELKEKENPAILYQKKQKEGYVNFYKEKSENEMICYFNISLFQFQYILMYILQKLLSFKNGFMLHSSAVEMDNNAYIFLGTQSAGKSTIMKFLHGEKYKAIADDSVIIKKEGNYFYLYQTPFIEKQYWIDKGMKRFNINKIFFLKKSNEFRIEKINSHEIILTLLLKQFWFDWIQERYLKKQLNHIKEFISSFGDYYYLYFAKDKEKTIQLIQTLTR